jgi:dihydroorotate dehydrogenase
LYGFFRFLLFCFPAEFSHNLGLNSLKWLHRFGLSGLLKEKVPAQPCELLGLTFPNPVGLAAGLDKNADYIDALGSLGFGFIEVGTITPRPQPGNAKPRLFRLAKEQAIINRMGFNNKGVEHLVAQIRKRSWKGILGVNIGKNLTTPVELAQSDYLLCLKAVYAHADYIVVNLSSPNTPGLRNLQFGDHFDGLLQTLRAEQLNLCAIHGRYVPMLIKVAPDVTDAEITEIAQALIKHGIDGVSATNTTIGREGVENSDFRNEAGGLSGKPVTDKSNRVVECLRRQLGAGYPIIGIGGIYDAKTAKQRREAGADLLQVYTGFIYSGPPLMRQAADGYRQADNSR